MRILLLFILLESALVRCDQDVQRSVTTPAGSFLPCVEPEDDNEALQSLMTAGVPIENKVQLSYICTTESDKTGTTPAGGGIRYDSSKTCYIITTGKPQWMVSAKWKLSETPPPGFESCRSLTGFQAVYVYQRDNADTYMILDPNTFHWFFTAKLSGCDIFVATSTKPEKKNKPIVIHSNLNSCGNKLQNLKQKGVNVDKMLKENPDYQNYKLAARVYSRPAPEERQMARLYLEKYELYHPGINLIYYDTWVELPKRQIYQFIGHYRRVSSTSQQRKWRFILKGERDGTTQEVIR